MEIVGGYWRKKFLLRHYIYYTTIVKFFVYRIRKWWGQWLCLIQIAVWFITQAGILMKVKKDAIIIQKNLVIGLYKQKCLFKLNWNQHEKIKFRLANIVLIFNDKSTCFMFFEIFFNLEIKQRLIAVFCYVISNYLGI